MAEDPRPEYVGSDVDNERLDELMKELGTIVKETLTDAQVYRAMEATLIRMARCSIALSHYHGKKPEEAADLVSHACTCMCMFSHVTPDEQIHEWTKYAIQTAFKQIYGIQAVYAPADAVIKRDMQA